MKDNFNFNNRKVWEFVESGALNKISPYVTAKEIYEFHISKNPIKLSEYSDFEWSGNSGIHENEKIVLERRENFNRFGINDFNETIPTYYDIKYTNSSKIFEAEEVKGTTPDQLQEAEKAYNIIIEKLENGEEIDEGFLSGLVGGTVGALAGPAIGKAICKVLGIDPKGSLGKLLTSRLVTTALGYTLGK